jgi:hypothetical protein
LLAVVQLPSSRYSEFSDIFHSVVRAIPASEDEWRHQQLLQFL